MVGFEWGKQDLSVNGNGAGQQNHANGHSQQPQQQQQPPQVAGLGHTPRMRHPTLVPWMLWVALEHVLSTVCLAARLLEVSREDQALWGQPLWA